MTDLSLSFLQHIEQQKQSRRLSDKTANILQNFYESYRTAVQKSGGNIETYQPLLVQFLALIKAQTLQPHAFELYHQQITEPFDFHRFGLEFVRPLVNVQQSKVLHRQRFDEVSAHLTSKENVILLANHQTEFDPQLIELLLESSHGALAKEIIFIAGDRVIKDPLAIPFSLGRNLICIYSKKHMDHPVEQRTHKQTHNQRSLAALTKLLAEGGKCVYVAPSGGRDRKNQEGEIVLSPFGPQSVEMMYLLAGKARTPCHFYSLALKTYDILPPPISVETNLGEQRTVNYASIFLCLSSEINRAQILAHSQDTDKQQQRQFFAHTIWQELCNNYQSFES